MDNMDAFDQILSLITVLCPPEVVMPDIVNVLLKKENILSNIYIILSM
jgi:hypothetical protein